MSPDHAKFLSLSTCLRPMGGKCPAIYGSSFDEKMQM
jgi:hypothetical protein